MVGRVGVVGVTAVLVVLLIGSSASGTMEAACLTSYQGEIFVPTLVASPPPASTTSSAQGVIAHHVSTVLPQTAFRLGPHPDTAVSTVTTMITLPDFNVAWYSGGTPFGTNVGHYAANGPESGTVPANANYAVVYMRYGPDLGTSDGSLGAVFVLEMGC
jgi:hypothetical protein